MKGSKCYLIVFQHSQRNIYDLEKFEMSYDTIRGVKDKPIQIDIKLEAKAKIVYLMTLRKKKGKRAWNRFLRGLMLK